MKSIRSHEEGMDLALKVAQKSLLRGEVPIGAIIVNEEGLVVSTAYNLVENKQTQTAHAEVRAIALANKKIQSWRLNGCWLYVTLEPCLMCLGLSQLSRVHGICFGAPSPIFGTGLEKNDLDFSFYEKKVHVISGVRKQECAELLQLFFKNSREKKKGLR